MVNVIVDDLFPRSNQIPLQKLGRKHSFAVCEGFISVVAADLVARAGGDLVKAVLVSDLVGADRLGVPMILGPVLEVIVVPVGH